VQGRRLRHRAVDAENQQGLVLATALLLLLLLTLLGVAALQASSLEQMMVANSRQQQRVFQAAEAGITTALRFAQSNLRRLNMVSKIEQQKAFDGVAVNTTIQYLQTSNTPPRGYSLRGSFNTRHFSITSHGQISQSNQTTLVRGFAVVSPGKR